MSSIHDQSLNTHLPSITQHATHPSSVNQLFVARQLKSLAHEARVMVRQRRARLKILTALFGNDAFKSSAIDSIRLIEEQLMQLSPDSGEAVGLQTQKSMMALYHQLPLSFIQADSASSNLLQLNMTMAQLSQFILKRPSTDPMAQAYAVQLAEIDGTKQLVLQEMAQADYELIALCKEQVV